MQRKKRQVSEVHPWGDVDQRGDQGAAQNQFGFNFQIGNGSKDRDNQHQSSSVQPPPSSSSGASILKDSQSSVPEDSRKRKIELLKEKYLKKSKVPSQTAPTVQKNHKGQQTSQKIQPLTQQPEQSIKEVPEVTISKQNNERTEPTLTSDNSLSEAKEQNGQVQKSKRVPKRPEPPTLNKKPRVPPPPPSKKAARGEVRTEQKRTPEMSNHSKNPVQQEPQMMKAVPQQSSIPCESTTNQQHVEQNYQPKLNPVQESPTESFSKKSPYSIPNKRMKGIIMQKMVPTKNVAKEFQDHQEVDEIDLPKQQNQNNEQRPVEQRKIIIDEQFQGTDNDQSKSSLQNESKRQAKTDLPKQSVSIDNVIKMWIGSPELSLRQIFPEEEEIIEFFCTKKSLQLKVVSNHPSFNSVIQRVTQTFVINNSIKLTEQQCQSAEQLCLKYFNSNANRISDTFLICLIKMGSEYLTKYRQALNDSISGYLTRLVLYRNLFLEEELKEFISFCIDSETALNIQQEDFFKLIMLTPGNSHLFKYLADYPYSSNKVLIALLCIGKLSYQQYSEITALYLRILSLMVPTFSQYGQSEQILNHLKELQIPENLYQVAKQLKLKMLKGYQESASVSQNGMGYPASGQDSTKSQSGTVKSAEQEKGLFGYFNINKAIDKIKTSTTNAITKASEIKGNSEKNVQEESEKSDIKYDPVSKRYLINGQIPQEEQEKSDQPAKPRKAPPPPPPFGKANKASNPPPKRGPRGANIQKYI